MGPFHGIRFVSDRTFIGFYPSQKLFWVIIKNCELVRAKYYRTTLKGQQITSSDFFFNQAIKFVSDRTTSEVFFWHIGKVKGSAQPHGIHKIKPSNFCSPTLQVGFKRNVGFSTQV